MADAGYRLVVHAEKLKLLLDRRHLMTGAVADAAADAIRDAAALVQHRAVLNVGGQPVQWSGGYFKVHPRTGALRNSIKVAYPWHSRFTARVFVDGTQTGIERTPGTAFGLKVTPVSEYAGAIEWGHKAIDLKLTMQGKVVPFFASRGARSQGPYSARGLEPVEKGQTKFGSLWQNTALNAKLQSQGKAPMHFQKKGKSAAYHGHGAGTFFIAFRRVGKTGWIIPEAEPRPFMRAALERSADEVRRLVVRRVTEAVKEEFTG